MADSSPQADSGISAGTISRVDTIGIPASDTANFTDPDGNPLTSHRRYAPYAERTER